MNIIRSMVHDVEVYSIDECFIAIRKRKACHYDGTTSTEPS